MTQKPITLKKSHHGWLHKHLGIPAGQPLTLQQLHDAAQSKSPRVRKEAVFAQNARKWSK